MYTIAIHDGHTAAAALAKDGEVVFAIQEERLVNEKNIGGFPENALAEILKRFKLSINDIDRFAFVGTAPERSASLVSRQAVLKKYGEFFRNSGKSNLSSKIKDIVRPMLSDSSIERYRGLKGKSENTRLIPLVEKGVPVEKISFYDHHLCHAAAAAYGWDAQEPYAVVTMDSSGDGISGTISVFKDGKLEKKAEIAKADSIARIYSLATYYMGMVPMEHEYKIMGMAPYSEGSQAARAIADYFISLFEISPDGLSYRRREGVEPVYDMGARLLEFFKFKRFDHICGGLQLFIEEFATGWIKSILNQLQLRKIALSGGLFMNVKLNKRIMELDEVDDLFIFPSCGDESNVFGAAYLDWCEHTKKLPKPITHYYMGGDFTNEDIAKALAEYKFLNCEIEYQKEDSIETKIAEIIANNGVVARFNGAMEFGARALGNRSILANPSDPDAVKTINKMIKNRDFWMPFAPSMIDSDKYVINPKAIKTPYMIMTFDAKPDKIKVMAGAVQPYDETCRPQEVYQEWNPSYYRLIKEYEKITGESVILNTSFNLHGFPLVYTPEDALKVMDHSGLKNLAIGDFLVKKK